MSKPLSLAVVLIGRNEGSRLQRCLASVPPAVSRVVYVDSGSTDGSVQAAMEASAEVVRLDTTQPFTAARARNAGYAALGSGANIAFVQFIDGDCEIQPGWVEAAHEFLQQTPKAAVVCGRRRERFPEASVYNRLCDDEWDTPIGRAKACGGDAMMRCLAFDAVEGFDPTLIAGEEPELCLRLRKAGWDIWRIDHEMTLHDADMTRLGQWWQRARRSGYASAEGAAIHGALPERHGVAPTRRALLWGAVLPLLTVASALISPWALLLLLIYPVQVIRLALREGPLQPEAWEQAFFLTLGKFPEAIGALQYGWRRLMRRQATLIEYK
ncbi:glycosyltransferase [Sedimentitalea sp.]|uniref:glycosyltransferase n=1 Tax=Sedimentitalea sp. TaxID=2048915 RepID=UPI003298C6FA